jgi:hypothetical protein
MVCCAWNDNTLDLYDGLTDTRWYLAFYALFGEWIQSLKVYRQRKPETDIKELKIDNDTILLIIYSYESLLGVSKNPLPFLVL